ncbi:hypothetical protein GSF24_20575 [Microbispora triticiradicis]|nr:hypothetical protein [Microbispora triticiradicis]
MAATTAGIVEKLAAQAAEPASIELEFGLKFTAQGSIVMAGVAAEASLTIKVSYAPKREIA